MRCPDCNKKTINVCVGKTKLCYPPLVAYANWCGGCNKHFDEKYVVSKTHLVNLQKWEEENRRSNDENQ